MQDTSIKLPGGYALATAIGYADATSGALSIVATDRPLPVTVQPPEAPAPLTGTTSASGAFGPFAPIPGRPVLLQLGGEWTGEVTLLRSTDQGATRHPLTIAAEPWARFTANACEPVWEESEAGAQLYLSVRIDSGTLSYRLA